MMIAPVTDPTILLVRALRVSARAEGATAFTIASDEQPWASATFTGTRHQLDLVVDHDAAGEQWLAALPGLDLKLRGFFVADLRVERRADTVQLEALTIAVG